MVAFLFCNGAYSEQGGKEGSAQSENVAALYRIESDEGAEIQPVHSEGLGKGPHGGKHLIHPFHLCIHFREERNTCYNEEKYGDSPYCQGFESLSQFVVQQCCIHLTCNNA